VAYRRTARTRIDIKGEWNMIQDENERETKDGQKLEQVETGTTLNTYTGKVFSYRYPSRKVGACGSSWKKLEDFFGAEVSK
jgi:hypothetical protein